MGDWNGAVEQLRQAIGLYEDLTRRAPEDWATARQLAESHVALAETLAAAPGHRSEGPAAAAAEYAKAVAIYARLRDQGVLPAPNLKRIDELRADEEKARLAAVKPGAR